MAKDDLTSPEKANDGTRGGVVEQSIGYVALIVADYDEAIRFYVGTLGFTLVEDT